MYKMRKHADTGLSAREIKSRMPPPSPTERENERNIGSSTFDILVRGQDQKDTAGAVTRLD